MSRGKRNFDELENGLNKLFISAYDGHEDVQKFHKIRIAAKLNESQVVIRDRSLPLEKDFGLTISNRAGMLKNAVHKILPLNKKLNHNNYYRILTSLPPSLKNHTPHPQKSPHPSPRP